MPPMVILLVAQFALGSGAVFGRLALCKMSALSVAAWRLGLVAVPLLSRLAWQLGWAAYRRRQNGPAVPLAAASGGLSQHRRIRMELYMLLAGLLLAAQFVAWIEALRRLSMGMATLLACTAPLWNSLYEVGIQRRRLPRSFWGALAVGMLGVGWTLGMADSQSGVLVAHAAGLGVLLALASSLLIALYLLMMRHISVVATRTAAYGTLDILTRVFSWGAAVLGLGCLIQNAPLPPLQDLQVWGGVVGMALITQGLGHSLQNAALRHLRASIVGFATLLEPLIAAGFGWLCFGETVGWERAGGGVLVVLALGYAMWLTAIDAQHTDQGQLGQDRVLRRGICPEP
jgi:drug/metabolite transporter (DMT)-like permease